MTLLIALIWTGSPPRRRGKVHSQFLVVGIVRITPAWAGKSFMLDGDEFTD